MSRTITTTAYVSTEVEVDVDVTDLLAAMDDKELAEHGLLRLVEPGTLIVSDWSELRTRMRRGDTKAVNDLLAHMAWSQGGVILPVGFVQAH